MSLKSNTGILFVISEPYTQKCFELISKNDAILLIEDGIYCKPANLPANENIFYLAADAKARNHAANGTAIDHAKWVALTLEFSKTVKI